MNHYPSRRYHPDKESILVHNEAQDQALGPEWVHSPAEHGHETNPGVVPDPAIVAQGEAYRARVAAAQEPKKLPRKAKP